MRIFEDTLCPKILFTAILFKKLLTTNFLEKSLITSLLKKCLSETVAPVYHAVMSIFDQNF